MTEQERFEEYWCNKHECLGDDYWFEDGAYGDDDMQEAWEAWQAAQQKEGYVLVKPALDSTAKAKMINEYTVPIVITCTDCNGDGCKWCSETGSVSQVVYVSWTTIKQIYKDGINCMIHAAQEGE